MKMRPGRASGRTYSGHHLAPRDRIADIDVDLRKMSVPRFQSVSMIDFDHVSISAFPAGLGHYAVRRSDHFVTAFAVNIHPGMKLIGPSTEGITSESEFVIDLSHVRPQSGDRGLVARRDDRPELLLDLCVFGIHVSYAERSAAVACIDVCGVGPGVVDRFDLIWI